jgi:hypothetical protein
MGMDSWMPWKINTTGTPLWWMSEEREEFHEVNLPLLVSVWEGVQWFR